MFKLLEVNLEIESLFQDFELMTINNEEYELTSIDETNNENILLDIEDESDSFLNLEEDNSSVYIIDQDISIVNSIEGEVYDGPYSVIPQQFQQILSTNNKVLLQNITVAAIPSNYGLITWNGSILTVS